MAGRFEVLEMCHYLQQVVSQPKLCFARGLGRIGIGMVVLDDQGGVVLALA